MLFTAKQTEFDKMSKDDLIKRIIDDGRLRDDDEHNHTQEIAELKNKHSLEKKDWEFQLAHLESEELKKIREENIKLIREKEVLAKELQMTKSIVELDSDVIDIKSLVEKLIDKLPNIDLKSLTVISGDKQVKK